MNFARGNNTGLEGLHWLNEIIKIDPSISVILITAFGDVETAVNAIKEGVISTEVIIQEGIPTMDKIKGNQAEPMLYLMNGEPVGGAYRVNDNRDQYSNLNAAGMSFHGMCDEGELEDDEHTTVKNCNFMVLGLIGKLATLAASREEYGEDYMI